MSDFLKPTKSPNFICFVCLFHPTYLFSPPKSPLNDQKMQPPHIMITASIIITASPVSLMLSSTMASTRRFSALVADRAAALCWCSVPAGESPPSTSSPRLLMRARGIRARRSLSPRCSPSCATRLQAAERAGVRAAMVNSANVTEWEADPRPPRSRRAGRPPRWAPNASITPRSAKQWLPYLQPRLGLLVVDEAHCISDWGHDFRPDYRRIGALIRESLTRCVSRCSRQTATANDRVSRDIAEQLSTERQPADARGAARPAIPRVRCAWACLPLPDEAQRTQAGCSTHLDTTCPGPALSTR